MGELCRQPSKVWWGSFPGADESDSADRPWAAALNYSGPVTPRAPRTPAAAPEEGAVAAAAWDSQREESSSPSGGSHGSQDSGFSDSELHQPSPRSSPQDSPDLSKRLAEDETPVSTPVQRAKTSPVKKFAYQVVEFKEENAGYLETDFSTSADASTVLSSRRTFQNDEEKVNKIQNQLELSFNVPKKSSSSSSLTKVAVVVPVHRDVVSPEPETDGYTSESVRSSCSEHTVIELPPKAAVEEVKGAVELDRDGFKIPKCLDLRGSCTSLNFASNPPLSCSTPKRGKKEDASGSDSCQGSPHLVRPARAHEKAKSFATVRKLKGLSRAKPRRTPHVLKVLSRSGCADQKTLTEEEADAAGSEKSHPVKQWLEDLEAQYEAEIMTTLQSKSLASDLARQVTNMAASTSDTVRKLHLRTKAISSQITKLSQYMKNKKYSHVEPLVHSLTGHIQEFINEYVVNQQNSSSSISSKCSKTDESHKTKKPTETYSKHLERKSSNKNGSSKNLNTSACENCAIDANEKCNKKLFNEIDASCNSKSSNDSKSNSPIGLDEGCSSCHAKRPEKSRIVENQCGSYETRVSEVPNKHAQGMENERESNVKTCDAEMKSQAEQVLCVCNKLRELAVERPVKHSSVDNQRILLAKNFREVVDSLLATHVKALVSVLEEPRTELALRTALSALCSLGLEGGQLSELVGRCEGVRALLAVILEARAPAVRVAALRALATVCCVPSTVIQFQQAGGVEIISDVLCDQRRSEDEVREAAATLAQVTAPWLPNNPPLPELPHHLPSLVTSLTRLIGQYKTSETLLLCSAAVANLTFLEPRTVWYLLENNSAAILLDAVRRQGAKVSVFIQEQAATVLANMAAIPEVRAHLAHHRAVVALLCFLQIRHSPLQRPPEISAAERVLQKTAIALSRLCSDATVARQVVELQGVNRLVRLCKDDTERNHSDGVLVACLAALRKIVANCGTDVVNDLNAMELIEPRLLDSFLLYSSRLESYV